MKSKKMKQGMSWLLCMVMLLSNNVTVLADETDSSGEGQTQDVSAEETEASTEEAGVTTELETEETVETTEQTEPVEEEQPVYNEAVQLRHEFKDENGNVISVVTADIQEGSFEADASAISMEVDTLTEEEDSYMQGLIRENLPEYTYLGDYVLYDVVFKVNGELTDPMKEIKLTYEGTGIDVQDIQDAVVCQYNVADPEVTDDKDSVTEIIQRDDMIRYMEENGEDTSKVDDHDLSEVVLNENGAADQISMEVRKSSIFGCYVEELSQETAFSQEVNGTTITVTAPEGAFPMDADQVSMAAAPLSEEQAAAVEEQLSAQAESQGQELKGYAAYDISLWANGEEIQPQKPVTVTMENTGLDVAETLTAFQVSDEDNSVSNIGSIDENGTVSMETAAVLPAGTAAFGEPEVQDEETVTGDTEQTTDETGETADSDKQDEISGEDENKEDTAEEEDKKTEEENIKEENIKDEEKDSNQTDAENEEDAEKETAETGNEKENIEKEETKNNSEEAVTTDENTADEENNEKESETIVSQPVTLTEEKGGVTVILTAPEGAFPVDSDQVSMTVEELTEEQKAIIEEQLQAQADENGQELKGYVAYDITLWANGEIIQPQVPVTVTFENAELDMENAEVTEGFQLDEETETLNNIEGSVEEDGSAVVEAEHFTPTGVGSFGVPEEMEANNNTPALQVETETTNPADQLQTTGKSKDQIVREEYIPEPTDQYPYFVNGNTDVRIQKNVAPTDNENEFYIYLNVEPQLSWEEILEMTGLWIINNANVGDFANGAGIDASTDASTVQSIMHDNGLSNTQVSRIGDRELFEDHRWYTSNNYKEQGPIDIEYTVKKADGSEKIYTIKDQYYSLPSSSEQVTILVRLPFQEYYSKVMTTWRGNTLCIDLSEDHLFGSTEKYVLRNDKVDLGSVTDPMGDYITYLNSLQTSNNDPEKPNVPMASYDEKSRSITWNFPKNKELPSDFQDYEVVTLPDGTKTVYWKNAYEMTYKIKLDTTKDGFVFGKVYDTNKTTTLSYSTEDKGSTSVDFNLPAVKAKTDEFIFQKVTQDGTPLSGAEFTLYAETDTEFCNPLAIATSGDEGKVIFKEDLQPGTYIMKETKVPENYVQADTTWKYIVKDNGTVELRDESGNIISPTAGNEYPQIQNYNIEGHLKTDKTAEVLNWDNRTYKIELYASHDLSVEWPKDIVLALDVSGSMAWTLSPPSSVTREISRINEEGSNAEFDQTLIGQPATVYYYKQFHYYAKDGADYKPIVYRPVSDTGGHPENAGWYYVGASRNQTVGYDGKIADQENTMVYVLDRGDQRSVQTKLEALQEAVTAFVENVKNISPESQIGIVTFSEILQERITLTDAETLSGNINDIFNNQIRLRGGTKQNLGLDAAYSMLDKLSQNQNKAVVLFTDGAPNGVSVDDITSSADQVKEIADLFTVGLYDSETAAEQTANMQEWASQPSDKYCFITSDTESLMKEFADLFASMNIAVAGATMRDYIDSRFVVTNSDGQVLETGAEIGDGGVLGYDSESGLQYVEWINQTISYSEDGKTAWNQTIFIKAKPEYIGGNDVTTNAGSGYSVTVNGVTENKESPIVNVKIDFKIGNAEDTIFFGENLQNYFTESKQKTVTDIQPTTGVNEYTIWKDVKEPQIQWFRDSACTQPITVQEIMGSAPQDETVYYAKVTVAPISNGDSGLSNTKGNSNNISGVSKTGTYTVHVVSGSIVIEKTIDKLPNKIPDSGLSFSFTVTNTSTSPETPCLVTIHFTKEELENGTLRKSFAVLDKLPQGIYTVKEDSNELYTAGEMTFSGVESNPAVIKNNSIYIGVMDNGEADPEKGTHLNRRDAKASVTNYLSDVETNITIRKEVTGEGANPADEFIITLSNQTQEFGAVLKDEEEKVLSFDGAVTLDIFEKVPMEYDLDQILIKDKDSGEVIKSGLSNGAQFEFTADRDWLIVVENEFTHTDYFHDKSSADNNFATGEKTIDGVLNTMSTEIAFLKPDPVIETEGGDGLDEIL